MQAVNETLAHLREMGARGMEGFALWAGVESEDSFQVTQSYIPDQRGIISESGVMALQVTAS